MIECGVNDAGRGFNAIIIDSKSKDVKKVGRFDTHVGDNKDLEVNRCSSINGYQDTNTKG
jgi:hypothetical protein